MTSVQVNRFQKRVLGLQAHHNLAAQRYSVSSKNYEKFSRSMVDSLVAHLAENDKKMKKTKRISKSRGALSQVLFIYMLNLSSFRVCVLPDPVKSSSQWTGFHHIQDIPTVVLQMTRVCQGQRIMCYHLSFPYTKRRYQKTWNLKHIILWLRVRLLPKSRFSHHQPMLIHQLRICWFRSVHHRDRVHLITIWPLNPISVETTRRSPTD